MSLLTRAPQAGESPVVAQLDEAAQAFLALVLAHGSRKIFVNPGTDTFPIREAWARRRELGLPSPKPVMCLHEHTAISAAYGCSAVVDAVLRPI